MGLRLTFEGDAIVVRLSEFRKEKLRYVISDHLARDSMTPGE